MTTTPYSPVDADPDTGTRCSTRSPGEHRTWTTTGVWTAGLLVAVAAAAATAHGLYEVVAAAGNPPVIAGLYPLITDGLALVAYTATTRLTGRSRSYAWTIVVLAAGLSGLAQATYLAGGVHTTPTWLRAGVGGWPAIAAAIVAHLLYLLGSITGRSEAQSAAARDAGPNGHHLPPYDAFVRPDHQLAARTDRTSQAADRTNSQPVVRPAQGRTVGPEPRPDRSGRTTSTPRTDRLNGTRRPQPVPPYTGTYDRPGAGEAGTPAGVPAVARDRAVRVAADYQAVHGRLPTATVLMETAAVGRGTAGAALKHLRDRRETDQPEAAPRKSPSR